jgi:hypothetical protein
VAVCRATGQLARAKLDDECCRARHVAVLPVDDAARVAGQLARLQPHHARVAALEAHVAAGAVDDAQRLVVPDRERRLDLADEPHRRTRLRLGRRALSRFVEAAQRLPAPREVPVQVDAVRVASGVVRRAVGVEHRHDPECDLRREGCLLESLRDRDARAFVSVDAADDEHAPIGVRVSEHDDAEGAVLNRVADQIDVPTHRRRRSGEDERRADARRKTPEPHPL